MQLLLQKKPLLHLELLRLFKKILFLSEMLGLKDEESSKKETSIEILEQELLQVDLPVVQEKLLSVGMIPLHNLSWLKMILGYSLQSVMYSSNLKMTWIFQLSSRSEQWKMDSQLQMFFHSLRLF